MKKLFAVFAFLFSCGANYFVCANVPLQTCELEISNLQDDPPMVTCSGCGGSGIVMGYGPMTCLVCHGKGMVVDPQYAIQRARYNGSADADISIAKIDLKNGNEFSAFDKFCEVYNNKGSHDRGGKAAYWIGVCFEYGFGTNVNQQKAKEFYRYSKEQNYSDGKEAYLRVVNRGFISATETNRQRFIQTLIAKDDMNAMQTQMWSNMNRGNYNGSSNSRLPDGCGACNGTGKCSSCAGRGWTSTRNGAIHDCLVCKGTGRCTVCHGTGK